MIEQASKKLALKKHTGTVINARLSDFKLDKAGSAINVDSRGISHIIYTYLALLLILLLHQNCICKLAQISVRHLSFRYMSSDFGIKSISQHTERKVELQTTNYV